MRWKAFQHEGRTYDLSHLHPRIFRFNRPAEGSRSAEVFLVNTVFTAHCFTRAPRKAEAFDIDLVYSDGYESRLFDFRRYELSKQLPEIVATLPSRKIYHNNQRRNFFTVEMITASGERIEYDVFFKMKKMSKGRLEMIVETAFVRDPGYDSIRPHGRPIRFWIVLHNTRNNIPIRS